MRNLEVETTGGYFFLTVIYVPSKKREKHYEPSYYILKINKNDFVKKFENEQIQVVEEFLIYQTVLKNGKAN